MDESLREEEMKGGSSDMLLWEIGNDGTGES
jgi:hypothetical protein